MTREQLKEHCENEIKMCEIWARRKGENSCRKVYEEHKLILELLEQGDILNKIRSEIEQVADKQFQIAMGVADLNERYAHIQMENAYRHCLNIIDEYKEESEE